RLLARVKGPASISRHLVTVGEATEVPRRSPGGRGAGKEGAQPRGRERGGTTVRSRVGAARGWRDRGLPDRGERTCRGRITGAIGRGWPPAKTRLDWPIALVSPTLFHPRPVNAKHRPPRGGRVNSGPRVDATVPGLNSRPVRGPVASRGRRNGRG